MQLSLMRLLVLHQLLRELSNKLLLSLSTKKEPPSNSTHYLPKLRHMFQKQKWSNIRINQSLRNIIKRLFMNIIKTWYMNITRMWFTSIIKTSYMNTISPSSTKKIFRRFTNQSFTSSTKKLSMKCTSLSSMSHIKKLFMRSIEAPSSRSKPRSLSFKNNLKNQL